MPRSDLTREVRPGQYRDPIPVCSRDLTDHLTHPHQGAALDPFSKTEQSRIGGDVVPPLREIDPQCLRRDRENDEIGALERHPMIGGGRQGRRQTDAGR